MGFARMLMYICIDAISRRRGVSLMCDRYVYLSTMILTSRFSHRIRLRIEGSVYELLCIAALWDTVYLSYVQTTLWVVMHHASNAYLAQV